MDVDFAPMLMSAHVPLFCLLTLSAVSVSAGCASIPDPELERRVGQAEAENARLGSELEALRAEVGTHRQRADMLDGSGEGHSPWHAHVDISIDASLYVTYGLRPMGEFRFWEPQHDPMSMNREVIVFREASTCWMAPFLRSRSPCPTSVGVIVGEQQVRANVMQFRPDICSVSARFACEANEHLMVVSIVP